MEYFRFLRQHVGHEPILTAGTILVIFNEKKEILMQLLTDYNSWGFPGGSMELGENFEQVAQRELKEETNLIIDELKLIDIMSGKETFRIYPNGDQVYDITAIYEVTKYHGDLKVNDDESKELKWFALDNIPNNLSQIMKNYWEKIKKHYV